MKLLLTILSVCLLALGASAGASTHTVGYVGCSNTSLGVEGYEALGGESFWVPSGSYHSPALTYSRGTVLNWQKDGTFFKQFDAFNKSRPASRVWFQVCQFAWESNSASSAAALSDLMAIHARAPTATVYVSALSGYTQPTCRANNPSPSIRDQLLGLRYSWVKRGPDMPALPPTQVFDDGCHPNLLGQASIGKALLRFFGK